MINKMVVILICVFFSANASAFTSESIWVGNWHGSAKTPSEETSLAIEILEVDDHLVARISLNDVGVSGWPVSSIEASANKLHIELSSDSGIQKIDLLLNDGSLLGKWLETGNKEEATVSLQKLITVERSVESRVFIDGPAGEIGASIITPNENGPFAAVVFIHGSGPQPRDTSRFAALRFAELGIASIIYDKRGVGESEGSLEGATFEALSSDAIAVASYMLSQTNISAVGFSGHSQGGWISTLAGSIWDKTSFVITSAGPAVSPAREAHWTVIRMMKKHEDSNLAIREARRVIENWHNGIRTGDWIKFINSYEQAEKKTWFNGSYLVDFSDIPSNQFITSYKAFMDYDPIPAIKSLNVPYLAILSPEDESIDAMETKEILENLHKTNISLRLYNGYDHSMRKLGKNSDRLRWPEHPEEYFVEQYKFIAASVK